jgi:DNA-binding beta-propeller fold protein YncE
LTIFMAGGSDFTLVLLVEWNLGCRVVALGSTAFRARAEEDEQLSGQAEDQDGQLHGPGKLGPHPGTRSPGARRGVTHATSDPNFVRNGSKAARVRWPMSMTRARLGYVVVVLASLAATGAAAPRGAPPVALAGSTIVALADGALVIDPDSGELVRVDAAGQPVARTAIGPDAAQVVFDRERARAYVSDRRGDRIAVVSVGEKLQVSAWFKTRAEPYGLALAADGTVLYVTSVADRQLSALDSASGAERWTRPAGPEPRGLALSPDGRVLAVASLRSGAVDFFASADGALLGHAPLAPAPSLVPRAREDQGRFFARNAFTLAFVGERGLVVPHQLSRPDVAFGREQRGSYGGSANASQLLSHRLTLVPTPERHLVAPTSALVPALPHQPRALAYDGARDLLFVAGFGDDTVVTLAGASRASIHAQARNGLDTHGARCGPSGLALGADGQLLVYCELSRRVAVVNAGEVRQGPPIARSRYRALEQEGRELFFAGGDANVSAAGAFACASCHPEGRADGLSWRIDGMNLQTPLLAGRTVGTHPYKWDGRDSTLIISVSQTVFRLGGAGITIRQARALDAFLATLARPRAPTPADPAAVERGRALFASAEVGCSRCHAGSLLTDGKRHELARDLEHVDTPSLIGLAESAPYYHDGSAATLRALLLGNGSVHGMIDAELEDGQVDDLVAFLETL